MLSYVIPVPSQEQSDGINSQAVVTQRNLTLNLSPQYQDVRCSPLAENDAVYTHTSGESIKKDEMLTNIANDMVLPSDSCDERTHLIICGTPLQSRHQPSSNNNTYLDFGNGAYDDTPSHLTMAEANGAESHANDKQLSRQKVKTAKISKLGTKAVGLKRVSFGSSKGSMVETLVFETPTPLSEHMESTFGFNAAENLKPTANYHVYSKFNMDDSGIEIPEELERSVVRVSIYQSNQPQQICAPEYLTKFEDNLGNLLNNYNYNIEEMMTAASTIPGYDRQQSTDSGWDNPFRPGGDLSREADEIVNMIRGGKPITPTEDNLLGNGNSQRDENCNGTAAVENVNKTNITQNQSAQNGTKSHKVQSTSKSPENNKVNSLAQVSKQVVPGPTSASHVVIEEKKNKKKGCCVIQ